MALKFSLAVVVFVAAAVAGDIGEEFCGCFGDDVAKNPRGLAPLKRDFPGEVVLEVDRLGL